MASLFLIPDKISNAHTKQMFIYWYQHLWLNLWVTSWPKSKLLYFNTEKKFPTADDILRSNTVSMKNCVK